MPRRRVIRVDLVRQPEASGEPTGPPLPQQVILLTPLVFRRGLTFYGQNAFLNGDLDVVQTNPRQRGSHDDVHVLAHDVQ